MAENHTTTTCPYCAETIKASAIKCRYCGEVLDHARFGALKGNATWQCPACCEQIPVGVAVCPECDEVLDASPAPEPGEHRTSPVSPPVEPPAAQPTWQPAEALAAVAPCLDAPPAIEAPAAEADLGPTPEDVPHPGAAPELAPERPPLEDSLELPANLPLRVPTRRGWRVPALLAGAVVVVGMGVYFFMPSTDRDQVAKVPGHPDSMVFHPDSRVMLAVAQTPDARRPADAALVAKLHADLAGAGPRASTGTSADRTSPLPPSKATRPTAAASETSAPSDPQEQPVVADQEPEPRTTATPASPDAGQAVAKKDAAVKAKRPDAAGPSPGNTTPAGPLTREDIRAGIQVARPHVQQCFEAFKTPGVFTVQITIDPSGRVIRARVHRSVAHLPVSTCLQAAVTLARFRPFQGEPITVTYPFKYE